MQRSNFNVGDLAMRVFTYGDNWIGIVEWVSPYQTVVRVRWAHNGVVDAHDIRILTSVKKCP
jgi:hypothetical protein